MERSIDVSTTIRATLPKVREILLEDPGMVFGEAETEEHRERSFSMDLAIGLGAGASVHQAVALKVGSPRAIEHGLALPVGWRASGREQLLPTFDGALEISESRPGTRVRLVGAYSVPLGAIGRVGDGVLGRRVADRSLQTLVERLASRLETEVRARVESVTWRPAPRPPDLREQEHSEIYVG
ncbi:MAG TPA: hypothetical protein VJ804_04010 [Acidimicrobiales bacterium]|nr:hypothetical protein [Acidimicrobiales bacterium]